MTQLDSAAKYVVTPIEPDIQVRLLERPDEHARAHHLLDAHHYLKAGQTVGERLVYALTDARGKWLGVAIFNAAVR